MLQAYRLVSHLTSHFKDYLPAPSSAHRALAGPAVPSSACHGDRGQATWECPSASVLMSVQKGELIPNGEPWGAPFLPHQTPQSSMAETTEQCSYGSGAWSPGSRCQQEWSLLRGLSLAFRQPSSPSMRLLLCLSLRRLLKLRTIAANPWCLARDTGSFHHLGTKTLNDQRKGRCRHCWEFSLTVGITEQSEGWMNSWKQGVLSKSLSCLKHGSCSGLNKNGLRRLIY